MFFCTNNCASRSINLSCKMFLYKKLKNCSIQSFEECSFFIFCLFCLLLSSNNTLHLTFYTYICYWNTFQYKYIIQIAFYAVRQSHAWVNLKRYLFTFYHIIYLSIFVLSQLLFISWSCPPSSLFNCPCVHLYLKVPIISRTLCFEVIYYPLVNILWICWMFIYAFFRKNWHFSKVIEI